MELADTEDQGQMDEDASHREERVYLCDRCGFEMLERNCKVVCPNCGGRWDCSDLSIYMD